MEIPVKSDGSYSQLYLTATTDNKVQSSRGGGHFLLTWLHCHIMRVKLFIHISVVLGVLVRTQFVQVLKVTMVDVMAENGMTSLLLVPS